ncbi:winged helix-turn-helix domain-containing protein [Dyella agri]|uniref:Winged helix-turn-helix transcriptional regulator n=1 Tax=Dyella agri TaxID=1926869 RepID=A0ABW8KGY7_9GAMM
MPGTDPDNAGIYRFDNILVEPAAHRLERDGRPLPVEPKAYALLLTLLRHAGELVSKDVLLDRVWGHPHVTIGVLNRVVSRLRRTLGDSPAQPRYIATVHSLGYRFIGDLQCSPPPGNGDFELPPHAPPPCLPTQAPATDKPAEVAQPPYRRRFTDGDQFLNCIDLQPCLKQLANWAALLPSGHTQRRAILEVLGLEYARLRASGMATPVLAYHEAILATLKGDRHAALSALSQAIDEGFRDELALRRDLAWRALTDDADFHHQQKRLDALLAAERALHERLSAR